MNNQDKPRNIHDQVRDTVHDPTSSLKLDENYARFVEYYAELKRLGISKKQQYNIPPVDIIGRKRYKELQEAMKKNKWL